MSMGHVQENASQVTATGYNVTSAGRTAAEIAVTGLFLVLLILVALLGNAVVILAVFMYHRLKNEVSNLFLVNLSVTDLSSASIVMTTSLAATAADMQPLKSGWCSLVCGVNYCLIIVSMLTLCFISLDRYVAIVHSLYYHVYVTRRRVLAFIAYAWLQGFAFGLAPILCDWVEYDYWEAVCAIQWYKEQPNAIIYVVVAFIICFFVPGIVLVLAYSQVLRAANKIRPQARPHVQIRTLGEASPPVLEEQNYLPQRKAKYSESSKAVRSLLIVVMAYFICMTPFSATKLYKVSIRDPQPLPGWINLVATFFQYASSVVNPLIYGICRRDFQKAFLYLVWRMARNRNTATTSVVTSTSHS